MERWVGEATASGWASGANADWATGGSFSEFGSGRGGNVSAMYRPAIISLSRAAHSCGSGAGFVAMYFAHRCFVACRSLVASTNSTPGREASLTEARSASRVTLCCAAATRRTDSRCGGGEGPKAQKMTRGEAGSTGGAARRWRAWGNWLGVWGNRVGGEERESAKEEQDGDASARGQAGGAWAEGVAASTAH